MGYVMKYINVGELLVNFGFYIFYGYIKLCLKFLLDIYYVFIKC